MQIHSAQSVPVVSMCHQKLWGPLWRSLVPTICGYYGPCVTKKCVGAYARPRLAYDILWVAVPTTLCCGWRTLHQLCLVGGGPCTLFSILYTGYSECIPMASMCHLNCVGPYGVLVSCTLCVAMIHVSPEMCGFLWCLCFTKNLWVPMMSMCHLKMRGSLWHPCIT